MIYDRISRVNHWSTAILFIGMLGFGFYLAYGGLPDPEKIPLLNIHKPVGVILALWGTWRVIYRLHQGFPAPASEGSKWQDLAARLTHWLLLLAIVLMAASGLTMALFSGFPTHFFGLFTIPAIARVEWLSLGALAVHKWTAYGATAALVLHLGGVLKHQFVNKDRTLHRMLSG